MPKDCALHKAANNGSLAEVEAFFEPVEGEDPPDVNVAGASERTGLHRAAGAGHIDIVTYLIKEKGANINVQDKFKRTPLHWAAVSGQTEATVELVAPGADIWLCTKNKDSPLHSACEALKPDVIKALITAVGEERKQEYCDLKNGDDKTCCDLAAAKKNKPTIQALKDVGDENAKSVSCTIM